MNSVFLDGKTCPYCNNPTEFVDSIVIYKTKSYGMIYLCAPCRAYVGVHKDTDRALGRLANEKLRSLKKEAHRVFDQLWKDAGSSAGFMTRKEAYAWLAGVLAIDPDLCHIGFFHEEFCEKVIKASAEKLEILKISSLSSHLGSI